jgi:hypothetical protein
MDEGLCCYNPNMDNPLVIRLSVVLWGLVLIGTLVFRGNKIANLLMLAVSLWLIYLGWRVNKTRKGE